MSQGKPIDRLVTVQRMLATAADLMADILLSLEPPDEDGPGEPVQQPVRRKMVANPVPDEPPSQVYVPPVVAADDEWAGFGMGQPDATEEDLADLVRRRIGP